MSDLKVALEQKLERDSKNYAFSRNYGLLYDDVENYRMKNRHETLSESEGFRDEWRSNERVGRFSAASFYEDTPILRNGNSNHIREPSRQSQRIVENRANIWKENASYHRNSRPILSSSQAEIFRPPSEVDWQDIHDFEYENDDRPTKSTNLGGQIQNPEGSNPMRTLLKNKLRHERFKSEVIPRSYTNEIRNSGKLEQCSRYRSERDTGVKDGFRSDIRGNDQIAVRNLLWMTHQFRVRSNSIKN